ncbi:MAG: DUF7901 domain-containing protein [Planctomycetota bacterium]
MKKSNPKSAFLVVFVAALIMAFGPGPLAAIAGDIAAYDWGDAPDPTYPTLAINNGASHVVAGPWLGGPTDMADPEPDGQPNPNALGDDTDGNNDEDGVSIPPLIPGQPGDITLEVSGGAGIVQAWIDFNADGSWQASEQIYDGFLLVGTHIISFLVPDGAVVGQTFARFRISRQGGLGPEGPAQDGEVEDHRVSIGYACQPLSGPTSADQQFIRGDANQDYQVDETDAYFIMDYLFVGGPSPECMDAADADDSGTVDRADVTLILNYKFLGTAPPPPPFPDCGPDPTDDSLTCDKYDLCPGSSIPVSPRDTKWVQLPDVTNQGIDIRVDNSDGNIRTLADDFECRSHSLITDVHLWGSWKGDEKGLIKRIHLSIHPDDPAGPVGSDPENEFSKPAPDVLWAKDFLPGQFGEALYHRVRDPGEWWWDPVTGELRPGGDTQIWQIDIDIEPDEAFLQTGTLDNPVIYWLAVKVDTEQGEFGWKTRRWPDHYMDDAVCDVFFGLMPHVWRELRYPKTHPYHSLERNSIDMAFCLTYTEETPGQPTSRPGSITHCPAVETRCPPVPTRCPTLKTKCPPRLTLCPSTETECSATAITECPPSETTCPAMLTQCPAAETKCPADRTKCPPAETRCPPRLTRCPPAETACSDTLITECPPTETTCPAVLTECPASETRCPTAPTKCPEYETRCPAEPTKCPAYETRCPAEPTKCPAYETRCPPRETRCPVVPTNCPVNKTRCPESPTNCPPMDTECPPDETHCPPEETDCEPVDTECPAYDTECNTVDTECPAIRTECPAEETACEYVETKCGPPPTGGGCLLAAVPQDVALGTKAAKSSPVTAYCPAIDVQCPSVVPKHLLAETRGRGPVAQNITRKTQL